MGTHLLAVLGLVALVVGWAGFQEWARRREPRIPGFELRARGCGGCLLDQIAGARPTGSPRSGGTGRPLPRRRS